MPFEIFSGTFPYVRRPSSSRGGGQLLHCGSIISVKVKFDFQTPGGGDTEHTRIRRGLSNEFSGNSKLSLQLHRTQKISNHLMKVPTYEKPLFNLKPQKVYLKRPFHDQGLSFSYISTIKYARYVTAPCMHVY